MTLADVVEKRQEEIGHAWLQRVRARLGRERLFTEDQLLDSLNLFLPEVVASLRAPEGAPMPSYVAQAHGGQRHVLGANIAELVLEYSFLYEVIAELAGQKHDLTPLARFLFGAAADAAQIFTSETAATLRKKSAEHFAFVAHEIRNPLISARLAAELLRKTNDPRALDALDRSLATLVAVVDQSLSEARMNATGVQPQLALVRLDKLVDACVEEAATEARARKIDVRVKTPRLEVNGDARLLRSALTNIIRNAIKFSRERGTVRIELLQQERLALVAVADECGGLPPDKAENLFAAFYQANADRTGFGLGLAIARQALEAHRGTIRVRDNPPTGCVFTLELPIT